MLGLVLPDLYEAIANVGRISSLGESTVVELVESRVVERIDRVLDPKGRLKQLDVYACTSGKPSPDNVLDLSLIVSSRANLPEIDQ